VDGIKRDIKEKENKGGKWIHLDKDRDQKLAPVNKVMDLYVSLTP
jgi:hypothetical protein